MSHRNKMLTIKKSVCCYQYVVILQQIFQQACIIALHKQYEDEEPSSDDSVTDSDALLASDEHGEPSRILVDNQSVLCSDRQLHLTDNNNNEENGACINNCIIPNDLHCLNGTTFNPNNVATSGGDSIETLVTNGGTSSVCDVRTSASQGVEVSSQPACDSDRETCDVVLDELSDMSIDVDDEDLDPASSIIYVAEAVAVSEPPVSSGTHETESSRSTAAVSQTLASATRTVSAQDEGWLLPATNHDVDC